MQRTIFLIITLSSLLICSYKVFAEELKIGVVLGLTGYANIWSDYARKGMELALWEVNSKPRSNGKTIKLIYEDSQSKASGAVSSFNKLVHQNKVNLVIGDVWSFLTIPLISLAAREKIILISPTVMDDSLPEINEYYFSMGHRFESLREPMRKFFTLHPHIKRAATISFDDYWNSAFVKVFTEVAQERNVTVIKSMKVSDFNPDFRTEMAIIKHSGADMLLTTWKPEKALQRMKEQDYHVPYLCSSDAVEAVLFRSQGKALFEGMYFIDWKPSDKFIHKFNDHYGIEPLYEAQNSYEIIRSISKAIASNVPDLRQALSQVSYDGVGGRIDFKNSRFPNIGQAKLFRVHNEKFVEE